MSDSPNQMKYCSNCKQDIAAANFVMHEVHCRRNIILCPKCSEPVPRSKLEEHEEEEHALVPCSICQKNFEKSEIETHTENCPRRPVQCVYCEIECPHDELQAHMEYCGTRTEQCVKCSKFIMHKDLLKHDETNCQFPPEQNEPASSSSSESRNKRATNIRYGDSNLRSSFVFGELDRMMTNPSTSQSRYNTTPAQQPKVNNRQSAAMSAAAVPVATSSTQRNVIKKRNPITPKNVNQRPQKTDNLGTRNRNVMRDSDLDDMLARQLANDMNINGEGEFDHNLLDEYSGYNSTGVTPTNQVHASGSTDDPGIPCEYCGDEYPLSSLLQHQTNCDANEGASNGFGDYGHNTNSGTPVNTRPPVLNNASGASNEGTNTQLNFINNLDLPQDFDWSPSDAYNPGIGDDVMIPCEFCDEVFPQEMLFYHQPVCNRNPFKTPRVMTPKVSNSTRNSHLSSNLNFNTASSSTNRNGEPKLTTKDRPPGMRYGANTGSTNAPSGIRSPESRRTPEVRKATTVNKTRTVLNEFMHNPSYTPVHIPPKSVNSHTNVGSTRARNISSMETNGYQPTAMSNLNSSSSSRVSSKPRVVQRRNYDTSVLGDSSRVTSSRNQVTGSTDTRNTKPKTRKP